MTLPPLRALQAFEAFGRTGSVSGAARALGVTSGAISQQLKLLEAHVGVVLIVKDGRRVALSPAARGYHALIAQGFDRLALAQATIAGHRMREELTISGLPTLLHKWLNPIVHRFLTTADAPPLRFFATHSEPGPQLIEQMFRLTYGRAAQRYAHSRVLFTDICFPVCAPEFLARHPDATDPTVLARLPLIGIDWGAGYASVPRWDRWFAAQMTPGAEPPQAVRPVTVHSLSGQAIDAAQSGLGAVLAQASFVAADLASGRLVRLSPAHLPMPESYAICWGQATLDRRMARDFLNWILVETRALRAQTVQEN